MSNHLPLTDPEKVKQTVANSRHRRLEMELAGLELEEVIAKLERHNRQQRMKRLTQVLNDGVTESQPFEQNTIEVSS